MIDQPNQPQDEGFLVGRRTVLGAMVAAGVLTPLVGSNGIAQAAGPDGADDWYPIPEESGSVPWW